MFLDKIVHTKKNEVQQLAAGFKLGPAEKEIAGMEPGRGFIKAVTAGRKRSLGLIAEVKKASPSKGLIRSDFQPEQLALSYERAGADCLSVLTDVDYFQGSNAYLSAIRDTVGLPLLRKDFIIDYRQVYEARLIGADAVLLIAAILKPSELKELHVIAESLGLDVLTEVHDEREMYRVLELGLAKLVGVNNRNLHTFETDLETTGRLAEMVPPGTYLISESAISTPEHIQYVASTGACGVLVGEHFMRQPDPGQAVLDLMGAAVPG